MSNTVRNGQERDNKGRFLHGNSGRPKGAKDKFTNLKEEFLKAFYDEDGIGGAEGIKKLMRNNTRNKLVFLQMIAKMLPSNLNVSGDMNINMTISDKFLPRQEGGAKENDGRKS